MINYYRSDEQLGKSKVLTPVRLIDLASLVSEVFIATVEHTEG